MVDRFPFPPYPNGWFRAAYTHELAVGDVWPLHFFGRDLVLFRDAEGVAVVLDAHCRHLGAHLGYGGKVEGRGIRCPFHAWLWDRDGGCRDIPYAKRIPVGAQMRAWTLVEKNGLVMIHHDAHAKPPAYDLPDLPQVGAPGWTPLEIRRWKVKSRWLDMNENAVDQVHFRFVHGTKTTPRTEVEQDGHVLRCRSRMQLGTPRGNVEGGIDTTDFGPGFQTVHLTGIVETLMLNTSTPIDGEYTDVSFAYTVNTAGDEAKARGVGAAIIRDLEKQMGEDIPIWENKKYYAQPLLCDGDGAFGVYRRWMRQFFDEVENGESMTLRAIDCWVNVNMSGLGRPDYLKEVAKNYFKQGEDFFRDYTIEEILKTMDGLGVEKAILTTDPHHPQPHVMSFAEKRPDRFFLGAQLDPRRGMKAIRALESFVRDHNVVLARITPFMLDLPPNHAVYYPVYAKCIELDLPITINTGIPGPPAPGECQHPMHLDKVCLHFPELKLVMAHGADPWWSEACRLMLKYHNLTMMTSAYLPKYFPPELLHFMNTRGKSKVMFASDHPAIQMDRCLEEALALDVRPGVLESFLYENANRVFFSKPAR